MQHIRLVGIVLLLILPTSWLSAQDLVNDSKAVIARLQEAKQTERSSLEKKSKSAYEALNRLLDLGDWDYVAQQINTKPTLSAVDRTVLQAKLYWLRNDFQGMEQILLKLSKKEQADIRVQRALATLKLEAWELEQAEEKTKALLTKHPKDVETQLVLGRALMLQKKYPEALALANAMINDKPTDAAGYFLKANVFFWDQKPKEAEGVLVQGLALDPLQADARFYYGYAIWRRIDATQLNDMMAQWELALTINPLQFQTHWHIGNGHTNLTFADYVDADEKQIRAELESADSLFTANNLKQAFLVIEKVKKDFPNSVLPAMHEASLLYGDFDAKDRMERLEKAEQIFLQILARKPHYGPAHNGLSAVIKSKRIPYLKTYPSIMASLRNPGIDNMADFLEIFPDVAYYPGNVAKGMAWNQLYTSTVYFPFLVKQHRLFVIPPLHVDLALAMKAPYFRFNSTFDNRQWMDIRGVGSGAAAIEYVERGAFEERNVLLHEYVHLFHGQVMTDEQNRRIKSLYYNAMENGLTLDYYSQNNESEYFAQTYPAYFEKVKVHPLDFKSMNTLADLKGRDPQMYAFLDELIGKEKAYLAGDKKAMASNWSQVYLNLASYASRNDLKEAIALLDTALQYDPKYLPAILAYSDYLTLQQKYAQANSRLNEAKSIDAKYAPIYLSEARWLAAQHPTQKKELADLYQQAYALETDYMEKARISGILRSFYFQDGDLPNALKTADEYVKNGSEISTYLRDRKDDSKAFAAWQRALLGDTDQIKTLAYLVSQKPQNYSIRTQYVEALLANAMYPEAIRNLKEVYRTLQASQVGRGDFELLLLEAYLMEGNAAGTQEFMEKMRVEEAEPARLSPLNNLKLVRLLIQHNRLKEAEKWYVKLPQDTNPIYRSSDYLTQALFQDQQGNRAKALQLIDQALEINAYQIEGLKLLKNWSKDDPKAKKSYDNHVKKMEILPKI